MFEELTFMSNKNQTTFQEQKLPDLNLYSRV